MYLWRDDVDNKMHVRPKTCRWIKGVNHIMKFGKFVRFNARYRRVVCLHSYFSAISFSIFPFLPAIFSAFSFFFSVFFPFFFVNKFSIDHFAAWYEKKNVYVKMNKMLKFEWTRFGSVKNKHVIIMLACLSMLCYPIVFFSFLKLLNEFITHK